MTRRRRRRGTERDTIAPQALKLVRNHWAPYEILAPEQIDELHRASLTILEEVGVDFLDAEVLSIWESAGAKVDHGTQHVWIDRALVEQALTTAPGEFEWASPKSSQQYQHGWQPYQLWTTWRHGLC